MSHPRSTCSRATPGTTPARVVCLDQRCPDDSHVGVCVGCDYNTDPGAPRPQFWPAFAERLKAVASADEVGVGDTAAREIARLGQVGFEVTYNVNFGPSCGCQAKEWGEAARAGWNARYAYGERATAD